jgi:hypothetical protein
MMMNIGIARPRATASLPLAFFLLNSWSMSMNGSRIGKSKTTSAVNNPRFCEDGRKISFFLELKLCGEARAALSPRPYSITFDIL